MRNNDSDNNDFEEWMNNPENYSNGGSYNMGPFNDKMKNIWDSWNKNNFDNINNINYEDFLNLFNKMNNIDKKKKPMNNPRKPKPSDIVFTKTVIMPDDYQRLLEIRGYLNITEQYAYVKTLDKILTSMNPYMNNPPKDNK